jgi:hypothetical protein
MENLKRYIRSQIIEYGICDASRRIDIVANITRAFQIEIAILPPGERPQFISSYYQGIFDMLHKNPEQTRQFIQDFALNDLQVRRLMITAVGKSRIVFRALSEISGLTAEPTRWQELVSKLDYALLLIGLNQTEQIQVSSKEAYIFQAHLINSDLSIFQAHLINSDSSRVITEMATQFESICEAAPLQNGQATNWRNSLIRQFMNLARTDANKLQELIAILQSKFDLSLPHDLSVRCYRECQAYFLGDPNFTAELQNRIAHETDMYRLRMRDYFMSICAEVEQRLRAENPVAIQDDAPQISVMFPGRKSTVLSLVKHASMFADLCESNNLNPNHFNKYTRVYRYAYIDRELLAYFDSISSETANRLEYNGDDEKLYDALVYKVAVLLHVNNFSSMKDFNNAPDSYKYGSHLGFTQFAAKISSMISLAREVAQTGVRDRDIEQDINFLMLGFREMDDFDLTASGLLKNLLKLANQIADGQATIVDVEALFPNNKGRNFPQYFDDFESYISLSDLVRFLGSAGEVDQNRKNAFYLNLAKLLQPQATAQERSAASVTRAAAASKRPRLACSDSAAQTGAGASETSRRKRPGF